MTKDSEKAEKHRLVNAGGCFEEPNYRPVYNAGIRGKVAELRRNDKVFADKVLAELQKTVGNLLELELEDVMKQPAPWEKDKAATQVGWRIRIKKDNTGNRTATDREKLAMRLKYLIERKDKGIRVYNAVIKENAFFNPVINRKYSDAYVDASEDAEQGWMLTKKFTGKELKYGAKRGEDGKVVVNGGRKVQEWAFTQKFTTDELKSMITVNDFSSKVWHEVVAHTYVFLKKGIYDTGHPTEAWNKLGSDAKPQDKVLLIENMHRRVIGTPERYERYNGDQRGAIRAILKELEARKKK